jgi:hypothetical protein
VGSYVRAFCASGDPPPLREVLDFARDQGSLLRLDPEASDAGPDDPGWERVGLLYKDGKLPILLEVNRNDADDSLAHEEIEEFLEFLEDAPRDDGRRKVEDHLRATRFVVAAQLPTSDIDDDGYDANGWIMRFFVERHGAMIQADGEGFYDGDKVIVELD